MTEPPTKRRKLEAKIHDAQLAVEDKLEALEIAEVQKKHAENKLAQLKETLLAEQAQCKFWALVDQCLYDASSIPRQYYSDINLETTCCAGCMAASAIVRPFFDRTNGSFKFIAYLNGLCSPADTVDPIIWFDVACNLCYKKIKTLQHEHRVIQNLFRRHGLIERTTSLPSSLVKICFDYVYTSLLSSRSMLSNEWVNVYGAYVVF